MGLKRVLVRALDAALDVAAPPACLACSAELAPRPGLPDLGLPGLGLCGRCLQLVGRPWPDPCPRCAGPLGPGAPVSSCTHCARWPPRFSAAVAAGPYAGFLGELVRRAKYGRDPLLVTPLARLLRDAVITWPGREGVDAVVPVPATRQRRRERGFHAADVLASAVARALALPCRDRWLRRVGEPAPQAALPRTERRAAARGTVEVARGALRLLPPPAVAGLTVLVVDDVLTTGSTADACATALLAAGARDVRVAVATRA